MNGIRASSLCDLVERVIVQADEKVGGQRFQGVGSPVLIAELHFADCGRVDFDDGADLAADQTFFRQILKKRYRGKIFEVLHTCLFRVSLS